MQSKDIRKQQTALLQFERILPMQAETLKAGGRVNRLSVAGGLASVVGASLVASYKLGSLEPIAYASKGVVTYVANVAQDDKLLVSMAEAATKAHAAIEQMAVEGGLRLLQAGGGTHKEAPPSVVVKSILGL